MKNLHLLLILTLTIFLKPTNCSIGLDMSQLFSPVAYTCAKVSGFSFVIQYAYFNNSVLNPDVITALNRSKSVGFVNDISFLPCRGKSPIAQVDELMSVIPKDMYNKVWVRAQENDQQGCSWTSFDSLSNCQYMSQLLIHLKYYGKQVGIYSAASFWEELFGNYRACTSLTFAPLYYIDFNNQPNFDGFRAFGGWTQPGMKEYSSASLFCGLIGSKVYRP